MRPAPGLHPGPRPFSASTRTEWAARNPALARPSTASRPRRSRITQSMPRSSNRFPRTSPAGPAPTITTSPPIRMDHDR